MQRRTSDPNQQQTTTAAPAAGLRRGTFGEINPSRDRQAKSRIARACLLGGPAAVVDVRSEYPGLATATGRNREGV